MTSFESTFRVFFVFVVISVLTSCHHNTTTPTTPCAGMPVFASWKVDGTSYQATGLFGSYGIATSTQIFACVPSGTLAPCVNMKFPQSIHPGTFDLKRTSSYNFGATYTPTAGHTYYTDATTNVGTFTVTTMNMTDSTYRASFQFTAEDSLGNVVHVTDGQIIDVGF